MKVVIPLIGWAVGYMGLDRYAYHASDHMSNGYHPIAFFGALLELASAIWLAVYLGTWYGEWISGRTRRQHLYWLGGWCASTGLLAWWTASAYANYESQLPEFLASFFRFYFTPVPLWLCVASVLGTVLTLGSLRTR